MNFRRFLILISALIIAPHSTVAQVAGKVFSVMGYNQVDSPLRVLALSTTDDSMARSVKLKNFGTKRVVNFKLGYSILVYDGQSKVAQGNLISKEGRLIDQLFDVDVEPGESVALANVSLLSRSEALQFASTRSRWHHYVFVFGVTEIHFEDGSTYTYDLVKEGSFKLLPSSKPTTGTLFRKFWKDKIASLFLPTILFAQVPEPEEGTDCPYKLCDHSGGQCVGSNGIPSKCSEHGVLS